MFKELKANGVQLQVFTYGAMSMAYAKGGELDKAQAMLAEMREEGAGHRTLSPQGE